MSKLVWTYDPTTKVLVGSGKQVSDDYLLQSSETFMEPEAGLIAPLIWDGTKWTGTSIDDVLLQPHPTPQDQINAQLTKQLAAVTKTAETTQSAVVALTKQLAEQAKEA